VTFFKKVLLLVILLQHIIMPALSYNRYKKDNNREKMSHCQTYYCCLLLIDKVRAQDKTYI
jgi:predicted RNA-binding Zn ribbon-like protein